MPKHFSQRSLAFAIAVCTFGMLTTLLLAFNPPVDYLHVDWRKPLIGSMFAAVCTLGIFAAAAPEKCLGTIGNHGVHKKWVSSSASTKAPLKGHHADCGKFSAHVIFVRNKVLCASCSGLAAGALIALAGTAAYFFLGVNVAQNGPAMLATGELAVAAGLIEFRLKGYQRLLLNALFVVGGFLTLVGVDSLTENLLVDVYLMMVIVACVLARVQLSQWDHWRICRVCIEPCRADGTRPLQSSTQPVQGTYNQECSEDYYGERPDLDSCGNDVSLPQKLNQAPQYYDSADCYTHDCAAPGNSEAFAFHSPIILAIAYRGQ